MAIFAESIVAAAGRGRAFAERLLKDVTPKQFARKPSIGGQVIDTNHPAFVFGHLSLYPRNLAIICSLNTPGAAVPDGYESLFKNGQPCLDDPEGKIYPAMDGVVRTYFAGTDAILDAVGKLGDADFNKANPHENYAKFFPTVGGACAFLLNSHVMMHLGQISAWRRCMGLGPA